MKKQSRRTYKVCGYPTKSGKPCQRKAGAGTDHPGEGYCYQHERISSAYRDIPSDELKDKAREWVEEHAERVTEEDASEAANEVPRAIWIAERVPFLKQRLAQVVVMGMMLVDYVKRRYREVPWGTIAAIVVALVYIVNPWDIIPDFIPGIGYIDDAVVVALVWQLVMADVEVYAQWKLRQDDCDDDCRSWICNAFPQLEAEAGQEST